MPVTSVHRSVSSGPKLLRPASTHSMEVSFFYFIFIHLSIFHWQFNRAFVGHAIIFFFYSYIHIPFYFIFIHSLYIFDWFQLPPTEVFDYSVSDRRSADFYFDKFVSRKFFIYFFDEKNEKFLFICIFLNIQSANQFFWITFC